MNEKNKIQTNINEREEQNTDKHIMNEKNYETDI